MSVLPYIAEFLAIEGFDVGKMFNDLPSCILHLNLILLKNKYSSCPLFSHQSNSDCFISFPTGIFVPGEVY